MELPYDDIYPGLHLLVIIITDTDGQVAPVIIPYFFPAGMEDIIMQTNHAITISPLAVAPKFGLNCEGTGDASGLTYNCTLDEEVTALQCYVDGQAITDCKLTPVSLCW